jgi:guanyl-specific ribonuclease Sa
MLDTLALLVAKWQTSCSRAAMAAAAAAACSASAAAAAAAASSAAAVSSYLVDRHSIDASRIEIAGAGSHEPAASNDPADGRAENRRAVVVISLG